MTYVLFPGEVTSRTDGQEHYITAPELARLYGVEYAKCKVVYRYEESSIRGYRKQPNDVELYPRYDGNYKLP
jgi:hypothetical protein